MKIVAWIAAMTVMLSLCACGSEKAPTAQTAGSTAAATTVVTDTTHSSALPTAVTTTQTTVLPSSTAATSTVSTAPTTASTAPSTPSTTGDAALDTAVNTYFRIAKQYDTAAFADVPAEVWAACLLAKDDYEAYMTATSGEHADSVAWTVVTTDYPVDGVCEVTVMCNGVNMVLTFTKTASGTYVSDELIGFFSSISEQAQQSTAPSVSGDRFDAAVDTYVRVAITRDAAALDAVPAEVWDACSLSKEETAGYMTGGRPVTWTRTDAVSPVDGVYELTVTVDGVPQLLTFTETDSGALVCDELIDFIDMLPYA